jgi:UPF0716 protein FxsA
VGLAAVIAIIALPFVEIYLAIQVAHQIGWLATVALLVVLSLSGPWLVKHHGLGVWQRARARVAVGEVPGRELTDGVFLLASGLLLAVPGFLTAALGILLLLPPIRAAVRWVTGTWIGRRARRASVTVRTFSDGRWREWSRGGGETAGRPIDAAVREDPSPQPSRSPRPGLESGRAG